MEEGWRRVAIGSGAVYPDLSTHLVVGSLTNWRAETFALGGLGERNFPSETQCHLAEQMAEGHPLWTQLATWRPHILRVIRRGD